MEGTRTAPPSSSPQPPGPVRKELSDDSEFGSAAIATGAITGATIGTIVPGFGTAVGATVGAGVGFFVSVLSKELNDDKRARYQPLLCSDDDD